MSESGHAPNRVFLAQDGSLNINGGAVYDDNGNDASNAINGLTGKAASVTITPAAGTANVCLVSIQVKNADGVAVSVGETLDVWLSDAATGAGLTGTTASGAVAAGASGTDLIVRTAKKETLVQTTVAGLYILSITDTAKTLFYIAVLRGSTLTVSAQLITANYG